MESPAEREKADEESGGTGEEENMAEKPDELRVLANCEDTSVKL